MVHLALVTTIVTVHSVAHSSLREQCLNPLLH